MGELETAPFYRDVAEGPEDVRAYWVRASDGVRLRVALWTGRAEGGERGADQGTVLVFNGRTECCEKYGRLAADFGARGFAMATLDWRGQGLADRATPDRQLGHVADFSEYQRDAAALLEVVRRQGLPEPYYMIAHSMGGCIGLRALHNEFPVRAAFFSAPMWGIGLSAVMKPTAWAVSWATTQLGLAARYAPGRSAETYLLAAPFDGNDLSTDAEMFAYMRNQVERYPDLGLGGPSLRWVYQALVEMRELMAMAPPPVPVITGLGSNERIVDPAPIKRYMPGWTNGTLRLVEGGEHELLMERPEIREALTEEIIALFVASR